MRAGGSARRPDRGGFVRKFVLAASSYQSGGLLVALLLLCGFFALSSPQFLTTANLTVILLQVAPVGLIAIPAAMLLLSGYIDLSVGAIAWFAAALFGVLAADAGVTTLLAAAIAIAAASGWGAANGYLTAGLGASPVVVTLAGFAAIRGLGDALTKKETRFGFGDGFGHLGNGSVGSIPMPAFIYIVLFAVGAYLWYATPLGRHLTAIGSDDAAANAVGVSTRLLPFWAYVATGAMAGLAGLIIASQLDAASPSVGVGLELQVLTAILLGGVAFDGGRGSLWGVLFGVLFVGVLSNGLVLLNVGPFYVNVAVGLALFVVAVVDVAYRRLEAIPVDPEAPTPDSSAETTEVDQ